MVTIYCKDFGDLRPENQRFKAQLAEQPDVCKEGSTKVEALGRLLVGHPEILNIKIEYLDRSRAEDSSTT